MSEPNPALEEVLFEAAVARPSSAERATFLDAVCRDNAVLRARLEVLLEGHFQAEGFLASESRKVQQEPAPPAPPEDASTFIGRYKLLEKLGEGGFGEVWMAEQKEPVKRRVALKIIKLGMDTKQVVARFEAERQALALMDHPNIAKVFDAGATDTGRPYFVMELVRGERITEFCDKNQITAPERLNLFVQVCRAIQHAHQKGIIHRDIKPSNILVTLHDAVPVPKIIDFGIAKATQQELTEKTVFTQFRQFLGTPAYISPEQAEMSGLDIDTRSDIYSLGVLLYELLTGKTPFDSKELLAAGLDELRRRIREIDPVRPSTRLSAMTKEELTTAAQRRGAEPPRLIHQVQGDLDWIVMKCLEKDRARRYETANGLARDIERHLGNEPVVARPPSRLYEFQKMVRRHWVGFAAAGAVLTALSIGVVVSSVEAVRARRAERHKEKLVYAGKMNLAQAAWEQSNIAQVRRLLEETAAYPERGFEWYYWQRQTHLELRTLRGHLDMILSVAYSPDGRRIVTGSMDQTAKVWDADSGKELLTLRGHFHAIISVAWSPDGKIIATASLDTTAKIWNADGGTNLLTLAGHTGRLQSVAFSPDSRRLVTSSYDTTARIWDAKVGTALLTLQGHKSRVNAAAFSPDGERVATSSEDQTARVWDATTGQELLTLKGHTGGLFWVGFSPDGRRIITGSDDRTARVWDAATGVPLLTLAGHAQMVNTARFFPDGQRIVTASDDRTAKVWDAATGQELFTIRGHLDKVDDAIVSPDGRRIVTASDDRTARIWDATNDQGPLTLKGHTNEVLDAAWSRDARRIVTGSGDQTARIWDATSGQVLLTLPTAADAERRHNRAIRAVEFSPDGRRVVTGSGDQKAKVWDATTGAYLFTLSGHKGPVVVAVFSLDGQWIATGSADRTAKLWEAATGNLHATLGGHRAGIWNLDFSPDSRLLVTCSDDHTARIWDVASGKERLPVSVIPHTRPVFAVAFSPDGQRVVTGCDDGSLRIWEAANGHLLLTLAGHTDLIGTAVFSPDGGRVLSCSRDQTAKLWDATSGQELLTLKGQGGTIGPGLFTTDGSRILTASLAWTVHVWDGATAAQLAAWQQEEKNAAERLAALERQQSAPVEQLRISSTHDPGAIKSWLLLGPISFEDYSGANALALEQVSREADLRPRAGEEIMVAGSPLFWREIALEDYVLDFQNVIQSNGPRSVTYAVCYLESDTNQPGLKVKLGSEDQSKLYLNGKEIYRYAKPRKFVPDQDEVSVGADLKRGLNVLVFKLVNEEDTGRGSIRLTDAAGQPLKGIRVTLEPGKGGEH